MWWSVRLVGLPARRVCWITRCLAERSGHCWPVASARPLSTATGDPARQSAGKTWKSVPGSVACPGRRVPFETDLSWVKEELTLYEIGDVKLYRAVFVLILVQYCFWVICANILYTFYTGLDGQGNPIRDSLGSSRRQSELASEPQSLSARVMASLRGLLDNTAVQATFVVSGHVLTLLFLFIMGRCVSFVRLMPGGRQVRLGTLSCTGRVRPDKCEVLRLEDMSAVEHRLQKVNYLSLRVRGRRFNYWLDSSGHFPDGPLYDHTVGLWRKL